MVKGKLLISPKHADATNLAEQGVKVRLVAVGSVIFYKNLKVRSPLPARDPNAESVRQLGRGLSAPFRTSDRGLCPVALIPSLATGRFKCGKFKFALPAAPHTH